MNHQIDKVVIPSGLIRSAKTYSLILNDDGLYVIHTGPAGNRVNTNNGLEDFAVSKVYQRIAKKVAIGEARLQSVALSQLAQEKGSWFLTRQDMQNVTVTKNKFDEPQLDIVTPQRTLTFHCRASTLPEIEQFVQQLQSQ